MTDADTAAAVEALVYRIKSRDAAIRAGEDVDDAEPFAQEYLAGLRGHGWRMTEAKVIPGWKVPAALPSAPSDATRAELDAARERLEAINAAKREARQDGAE